MSSLTIPKTSLLLAEDDSSQARFLECVLQKQLGDEVDIHTFTDAQEACSHIDQAWVDILVTDLDMPVVDGLELIRCAHNRNQWVQSIVLTAVSTPASLVHAGDLRATDYLLKPVDQVLLVQLVQQSIDRLHRWRAALSGTLHRCHPNHASSGSV